MREKPRQQRKYVALYSILALALIMSVLFALLFGGARLSVAEVASGLLRGNGDTAAIILRHVRLPRVLAALLAGVGLSLSGVLLQAVTDNGLASPNIIGVNSGAGLATILILCFLPGTVHLLPLVAFAGAFGATLLILWVAGRIGSGKISVILAGMAMTTILNAAISFVSLLDTDVVAVYNYFSVGGLSGVTLDQLLVPGVLIGAAWIVAQIYAREISALCLGDEMAASIGISVKRLRLICLLCASASAAAVVSFAGLLGFVGLIVPHIARRLVGGNVRYTLPASALVGGCLVILADMLGRTVFAPTEVPVGIVMALIGAPFFLILLVRKRRG